MSTLNPIRFQLTGFIKLNYDASETMWGVCIFACHYKLPTSAGKVWRVDWPAIRRWEQTTQTCSFLFSWICVKRTNTTGKCPTDYWGRKIGMQLTRVCVIWHKSTGVYFGFGFLAVQDTFLLSVFMKADWESQFCSWAVHLVFTSVR